MGSTCLLKKTNLIKAAILRLFKPDQAFIKTQNLFRMAEDEGMAFDPSLKKKKKKKKAFDLDAALAEDGSAAPAAPAGEEVAVAKPVKVKQASEENVPAFDEADADRAAEKAGRKAEALNMDDLDLDNLDSFGDKKKKKKKKRKGDVD